MRQLYEANGNVDILYSDIDKAIGTVEKAVDAVLTAAEALDDILVGAVAIGGKIEEIVPSNVKVLIQKLTNIADQELMQIIEGDQSSLKSLKDVVGSIPYRDLRPQSKEERIEQISMQPNLSNGPQSAIMANAPAPQHESFDIYDNKSLDFNALKESFGYGENLDPEIMGLLKQPQANRELKMAMLEERAKYINNDIYEETPSEQLNESAQPAVLDCSKIKANPIDLGFNMAIGDLSGGDIALDVN